MITLARLALFLGFVGFGLLVTLSRGARRRLAANALLGYLLVVSLGVGLSQHDAWPFSGYPIILYVGDRTQPMSEVLLFGVDGDGREHLIDWGSWAPVSTVSIVGWVERQYPRLPEPERRTAAGFLLARAELARQRLARGQRIGAGRLLGPLAAPQDWGISRPPTPSPTPYVALRAYRLTWVPRARLADPTRVTRTLLLEHRAP